MRHILFFLMLLANLAQAAGSVTVTREELTVRSGQGNSPIGEKITIDWTADASAATVPDTAIAMYGWAVKAVINPGSPAPTANYDISITDPDDSTFDAFASQLNNLHTSNTEQFYFGVVPVGGSAESATPLFLNGSYTFKIANNSQNSATGKVYLYLLRQL